MSKDIIIERSGVPVALTGATKLAIPETEGGESLWVPEDTRVRVEKAIAENGTYRAEDDGGYAYSRVTVNVALQLPHDGTTPGGTGYSIYQGGNGKPYIKVIAQGGDGA